MNKFFEVCSTTNCFCSFLLHMVPSSVSITAPIPLRNELESKNGVLPGTMAILKKFPQAAAKRHDDCKESADFQT